MPAKNANRPINLADKLLELAARQPAGLVPLITDRLGKREKITQAFVVQLTQRLREQDPAVMPVTDWLEKQLARQGHQHRTNNSWRAPTSGRHPGDYRKHHYEHASALNPRLARLL